MITNPPKLVIPFPFDRGFTLIELLVTLAVAIVLTSWVVLTVQKLQEGQRLASAIEAIQSQVVFAKSEAAKRSQDVVVRLTEGSGWVVGVGDDPTCAPAACALSYGADRRTFAVSGTDYPGTVTAASVTGLTFNFEPVRGTVNAGTVTASTSNYEARVLLDAAGNMSVCSPAVKNLGRYPACP
jgi:type IV fimbrial biogenesis protein FimT